MYSPELIILDYFIKCNVNYEITIDELLDRLSFSKISITNILEKYVTLNIIHQLGYTVYALNPDWYDYLHLQKSSDNCECKIYIV